MPSSFLLFHLFIIPSFPSLHHSFSHSSPCLSPLHIISSSILRLVFILLFLLSTSLRHVFIPVLHGIRVGGLFCLDVFVDSMRFISGVLVYTVLMLDLSTFLFIYLHFVVR